MNYKGIVYSSSKFSMPIFLLSLFLITKLGAITLEEAVINAIKNNPGVKERIHSMEGVKTERGLALSAFYPKVDLSVGIGTAKEQNTPSFNEQSGAKVTRTDNSIVATMNIFNGFNTYYDLQSQGYRAKSAQSYVDEYKTLIIMQTIESYITMMKQKELVDITKENVFAHQEIYNKLKEYTDSGMGKASDLRFASGRLTLAEVNSVVSENNFIQSKVIFETTLGSHVEIDDLEEPSFDYILPDELEDAAVDALKFNPSILVGENNIKSAYANYKRSQSAYYPSLDIEVRESILDEKGAYNYTVESSTTMLYLTYNLFNGLADKAIVEKEFYTYLQNKQFVQTTKRDVTSKLGVAWIASIKIAKQLQLLDKLRDFSRKTLEDYYQEFGIGRRTLLDIINVKNDYNNARQSYAAAKYDLLLSKFRIMEAMGSLIDYFSAKKESLHIMVDKDFEENRSVYDIIKQMNEKLQKKEEFIKYDESKYITFDAMIEEHEPKEDLDLDPYDSLEELELEAQSYQKEPADQNSDPSSEFSLEK